MSIYAHFGELRKRLIITVLFFAAFMVLGLYLAKPVIIYLQEDPVAHRIHMNAFNLTDPLKVYLNFSFIIAFLLTFPVILYQIWAFVSPGLYENERRVTLSYIPISFLLFIGGISFSYFVLLPLVVHFMTDMAESLNVQGVYGINEYFSFLFKLILPFGLIFQFPVVVLFVTRLGLVTPKFLKKIRKISYFVTFVFAGLIAPPDLVTQLMITIPLIILYEISIVISAVAYKKKLAAEEEAELEEEFQSMRTE